MDGSPCVLMQRLYTKFGDELGEARVFPHLIVSGS